MLFNTLNISTHTITSDSLTKKNISLHVLRLDKIHPTVSGNKLFKLHYFLLDAIELSLPGLITFGGPYSNHLLATAFACKTLQLKSIGFVRGEKPEKLSPTLMACMDHGMELHFIPRDLYNKKEDAAFLKSLTNEWNDYVVVPEGGYHPKGAAGAALITSLIDEDTTHICTPVGTATTLAGLLTGAKQNQTVLGVPVLKGMHDIQERVSFLTGSAHSYQLLEGYHFGGYAKKTPELTPVYERFIYPLPIGD